MERDRSKSGEPVRRAEERGRWRDASQREREQAEGAGDRMEAERVERDRRERGELMGRGGSGYLATRDPLLATHYDFMRQFMREMSRLFEGWGSSRGVGLSAFPSMGNPATFSGGSPYPGHTRGASMLSGWPPIEVEERDGQMVVRAELPGIDMQDVKVRLEGSDLVIEGERREDRKREHEGYYESEWNYGHFSRRIPIPQGVTPDQIHATCDNGVLELRIDVPSRTVREIPIHRSGELGSRERFEPEGREKRERDGSRRDVP